MKFILVCFVFQENNCYGWVKDICIKLTNKVNKGNVLVKYLKYSFLVYIQGLILFLELCSKIIDVFFSLIWYLVDYLEILEFFVR